MLWRALKHIPQGFWIDVGAAHPDEYSVTRAFSDHGWCGINIEANPPYVARIAGARPRDVTLGVAAGASAGSVPYSRGREWPCESERRASAGVVRQDRPFILAYQAARLAKFSWFVVTIKGWSPPFSGEL